MKRLDQPGDTIAFHLSNREKRLFQEVLRLYPLIAGASHGVSQTADPAYCLDAKQLLEEALAEQRREHKAWVDALLNDPKKLRSTNPGYILTLEASEAESLLQVLNDVRVGSWLRLGSPNERAGNPPTLTEQNSFYYVAMNASALFESAVLSALL